MRRVLRLGCLVTALGCASNLTVVCPADTQHVQGMTIITSAGCHRVKR